MTHIQCRLFQCAQHIFFLLYISINLFTGERGLISYFEKKTLLSNLNNEKGLLVDELTVGGK